MRFDDWEARFEAALRAGEDKPHKYGEFDCCIDAANIILAMTGDDWMAEFRGKYKSAAGASKVLKKQGKGTLLKTIISLAPKFGAKRIPLAFARKGDLVLTEKALHDECQGQALGVCVGRLRAAFPGERGHIFLTVSDWSAAFRI